jgi:hypothetical protein
MTLGLTLESLHAQTCGNPGGQLAAIARDHGDASRTTPSERRGDDVEHPDRGAPVMSDRSRRSRSSVTGPRIAPADVHSNLAEPVTLDEELELLDRHAPLADIAPEPREASLFGRTVAM